MKTTMMWTWVTAKMKVRWLQTTICGELTYTSQGDDYVDYDSDYEHKTGSVVEADPYAGEYTLLF